MSGLLDMYDPYAQLGDAQARQFQDQVRRGWQRTKRNSGPFLSNAGDAIQNSIMSVAQPDMGFPGGNETDWADYQQQQKDKAGTSFQMALGAMPLAPRFGGAMRAPVEAPLAMESPERITAYHGSPYDFDKFEGSQIGTGEAFGTQWGKSKNSIMQGGAGFHFAEHPRVAEQYRDVLAKEQKTGKGKVYEVSIPNNLMNLEGRVSDLPEDLQGLAAKYGHRKDASTKQFFRDLQYDLGEFSARDKLQSLGVKGTIHDDPLKHKAEFKGKNYSVFDPEDIEILRKYGLIGAIGASSAAPFAFPEQR